MLLNRDEYISYRKQELFYFVSIITCENTSLINEFCHVIELSIFVGNIEEKRFNKIQLVEPLKSITIIKDVYTNEIDNFSVRYVYFPNYHAYTFDKTTCVRNEIC